MALLEYLKQARHILRTDPSYAARNLHWRRSGGRDVRVTEILTLAYAGPR